MKLKKVKTLKGYDRGCRLRVSKSGRVLVGCSIGGRAWDTRTWKVISEFVPVDGPESRGIGECDLSPDGRFLAAGGALFTTQVFDTRTGRCVAQLSRPKKDVINSADHLAFSPDGRLLASTKHKKLEMFRVSDWQPAWTHPGHPPQIAGIAFTPDGTMLATASGKSVAFWSTVDGRRLLDLVGHKKLVHSAAMPADGSFVATPSEDHSVILWALPSGKRIAEFTGHEDMVFAAWVTSDGLTAASYDYNSEFHLWDTQTRRLIAKVSEGDQEGTRFSPDGRFLAIPGSGSFLTLRLIDARDGKVAASIKDGDDVAFFGRRMAVSQGDKVVIYEIGR
jgi:WD40 repeat protein